MFGFGMPEIIIILAIMLVVFGPGKLPELGKSLGEGIRSFRKASTGEDAKLVNEQGEKNQA